MNLVEYSEKKNNEIIDKILGRSKFEYGDEPSKVEKIVNDIKNNGDEALFKYTKTFDGIELNKSNIRITKEEIDKAYSEIDPKLIEVMKRSAERIRVFHEKQKRISWLEPEKSGELLGQLILPLSSVGVYVPGGKAAYPSSVLMNVIPAKVAGVEKIIMVTPPDKNGKISANTIVAAVEAGVTHIYKVGGAQAVAALAFGTESIPKVNKIVGPGNIYVALAKRCVFGYVGLDSVAGPSEILVIADESANPSYVAADLLSQAEHDELASSVLITTSMEFAEKVNYEIERQTERLERKDIIKKSLDNYGAVIVVESIDTAVELCNQIAPEHMEICTKEPFFVLPKIKNAGAVFLGNYTPEPLGDYMAGPNHVLPTSGTAKFFSPLSVDDFIKKSSVLAFSKEAFDKLGNDVIKFAEAEGLTAHANSVKIRMQTKEDK
ncbi:MAG: histidinol dehydrogenase [Clostridiales bacterium]|nr:histidinol dehydrogenase [Clostridiales bacterium]